jgi:hypothetical protein
LASHPPTLTLSPPLRDTLRLSALSLGFNTNALQQRTFLPTRILDIGFHVNTFDSGSDGRYGCLRNRLSTRRLQAQDRWPVSQPAKGV